VVSDRQGRKVVLDTETTGLSSQDDRIFEIACIEIWDIPGDFVYGEEFHYYLNPQQRLSAESIQITGMSDDFLCNKPLFKDIADELLSFFQDSVIVAHNVNFDIDMINAEMQRCGKPKITNPTLDTLAIARAVNPTGNNSLDSWRTKFKLEGVRRAEDSKRFVHSALKDTKDLTIIYRYLKDMHGNLATMNTNKQDIEFELKVQKRINPSQLSLKEIQTHNEFCAKNSISITE